MEGFAKRVRKRIADLGMSQAEVATLCGLTPQRFNNYLKTSREPDMKTLVRIAAVLNTTTDWLLGASSNIEVPLSSVVLRLLLLDGMPQDRAEVIALAAVEALRLLAALPDEGDAQMRSRLAAQAVWQSRGRLKPS